MVEHADVHYNLFIYSHFLKPDKRFHRNSEGIVDSSRILFKEITEMLCHLLLPLAYVGLFI